jgi:uncharacterized protein
MPDFFSQPAICNTGPLLGLYRVRQLELLTKLLPEVILPREVAEEIVLAPHADAAALRGELARFTVLDTYAQPDPLLAAELDSGEAAVIANAKARGLRHVIMDERKGRRIASVGFNLQVKGTGGLLLAAKQRGFVQEIRPLLEGMKAQGHFLSTRLMNECLRRAGEKPI